jgi:peroxiredoxin
MTDAAAPDFTLPDQAGQPWTLREHLDAAAVLVFYRGDW